MGTYTAELVCDSVFYGAFDERIAAALNAGDLTEAGRILKEACDSNLAAEKSEAAQAFDAKFGNPLDTFGAMLDSIRGNK